MRCEQGPGCEAKSLSAGRRQIWPAPIIRRAPLRFADPLASSMGLAFGPGALLAARCRWWRTKRTTAPAAGARTEARKYHSARATVRAADGKLMMAAGAQNSRASTSDAMNDRLTKAAGGGGGARS